MYVSQGGRRQTVNMSRCNWSALFSILAALCLARETVGYSELRHPRCFDRLLRKYYDDGARWNRRSRCSEARCVRGRVIEVGCREPSLPEGYFWAEGEPTAGYPACCRQQVRGCYRADTKQWVADGAEWTGQSCTQAACRDGNVVELPCGLIGLPPDSECRIEMGDPGAAYPDCCPSVNCSVCWAPELGRSVSAGESWTLEGCSGQATCHERGAIGAVGCALVAVAPGVPCGLNDGEPDSDDYPSCCPRITCPDCYSEPLHRFFGPSDTWTEPGCISKRCEVHPSAYPGVAAYSIAVLTTRCAPVEPPEDGVCTLVDGAEGEFPHCCPKYECTNYCFSESKRRYFAVDEVWTEEECTGSHCVGFESSTRVAQLPCGLLGPPPRPDCTLVRDEAAPEYPDCCHTYSCPDLTCFSEFRNRTFKVGDVWTEEGCTRAGCILEDGGQARIAPQLPCGLLDLRPGCRIVEGDQTAEYPDCCPTSVCY